MPASTGPGSSLNSRHSPRQPQVLSFAGDQEAFVKEPEPQTPPPFPLDHALESYPGSPMSATTSVSPTSSTAAGSSEGSHNESAQQQQPQEHAEGGRASTSSNEWDAAREQAWKTVQKRAGRRRRALGEKIDQARRTPRHGKDVQSAHDGSHQDRQPDRGMSLLDDEEDAEDGEDDNGLHDVDSRSLHDLAEDDLDEAETSRDAEDSQGKGESSEMPSSETMFSAFVEEFGELPQQQQQLSKSRGEQGDGQEQWLGAITAILIKSVTIRGALCMTDRRLAFVATVPAGGSEPGKTGENGQSQQRVIRKGPAVLHFPGWRRHRTAWFELRGDSLVCYRNSTSQYAPVGSARLSDLNLKPLEWSRSGKTRNNSTKIHLGGPNGIYTLEFYSHETAVSWYKDFEAAMWAYSKAQERVRLLVPLERIKDFRVDTQKRIHVSLHLEVNLDTGSGSRRAIGHHNTAKFEIGCFSRDICLINDLEDAITRAKERMHSLHQSIDSAPPAVVEVEGSRQKAEALDEAASHPDADGLSAQLIKMFTLDDEPEDLKVVKADIIRGFPLSGTLAVGGQYLIFYRHRLPPFRDVRVKVPLDDIVGVDKSGSLKFHYHGFKVLIRGNPSLHFEVKSTHLRDLVMKALEAIIEERAQRKSDSEREPEPDVQVSHQSTSTMYQDPIEVLLAPCKAHKTTVLPYDTMKNLPRLVNPAKDYRISVEPMRIACLTIGSRGDVQPYIALAVALKAQGHSPVIVSHPEYRERVEKYGIEFRGAGGDPGALMKLSVEHRLFSPAFFRESLGKFRAWLDELLRESFEGCWDAELIIESPSTMAGIHVAEALQCYYFRAFTMPWTRTAAFPQAFSVPPVDLGEAYNLSSYTLFDRVFWQATSGQINRWRRHMLGLASTNCAELDQDSVPFVYNFSPAVVPHPVDWSDRIAISGYWFLDSKAEEWEPPQELTDFMDKAHKDDKKIAYIGFGSITMPDPHKVTANIYEAVKKADVRAIVAKGWSGRERKDEGGESKEPEVPEEVYVVDSIPHDWLFEKIDVALHHGGAGSTGASLRAGLVTLIHPFFGDQFFWAGRVQKLGAGLRVGDLTVDNISEALHKASTDRIMREKAASVGELIQSEDGVGNAISFIETHLALSERKYHPLPDSKRKNPPPPSPSLSMTANANGSSDDDEEDDEEEMDKDTDQCIKENSTVMQRALSVAMPGRKSKPSQNGDITPSRSFLSMQGNHLPSFNVNITATLKDLVPGLHGDHGDDDEHLASVKEVEDEARQAEDSTKKGGKDDEKDDEEQRRAKKQERRSAKAEDERRRIGMEGKLLERKRILEEKKKQKDECDDYGRKARSKAQEAKQQKREESEGEEGKQGQGHEQEEQRHEAAAQEA